MGNSKNKYVDFVEDEHLISCIRNLHNAYLYSCQMKTRVFVSFFFPLPSLKL